MRRCGLRFGLLGPPVLYDVQGTARPLRSPKVRALLVALLLEAGRVVSVESLEDALWGGAPPPSARASLHNHVTRLRRLLDDPARLRAVPPGYLLRVEDGELDVDVFVAGVAAARSAHAGRDWERTRHECTAALALWRGAPLSGLPAEVGGYALVRRLQEARLLLHEWRYDAELATPGARLDTLVPELTELAAAHPLREPFHRQLMLALHHTGRRAEALTVHRDLRTRLIENLGIEPGPAVSDAHVEVLRGSSRRVAGERAGAGERASSGEQVGSGERVGAEEQAGPEEQASSEERARARELRGLESLGGSGKRGELGSQGEPGGSRAQGELENLAGPGEEDEQGRQPEKLAGSREQDGLRPLGEQGVPGELREPRRPAEKTEPGDPGNSADLGQPGAEPTPPLHHAPAPADGEDTPQGPPAPDDESSTGGAGGNPNPAEGRVPTPTPAPSPAPAPAQLPPPPANFTARTTEVQNLRQTLSSHHNPLTVISGMPGVGKSALALHVAHHLTERFPDGQLYINLHGATPGMPPLTPTQALTALLRDLGTAPRAIPDHPDAAAALLRTLLAPTRTLLVLDDAKSAAQVRPLLPAGPGCAVIVTSRSPLTALDGARRFPLAPLSHEDSAALLRAASGRPDLDATHPLVDLTGRLPLALRVVAARLAARQALTPDVLAGQLAATEGRLHHLEYDDLSVRRSLAVAHDALAASDHEPDRDAALALRRIGAVDLPTYGAPLLARLTGIDERRTEAALDRLVDVALLEEIAYGRYAPHDLVRDFARELAAADGETDTVRTALRWYAAVAERTLTAIVEPGLDQDDRRRPTLAQPPQHTADVRTIPPFDGPEEAFAWGDLELENVVALAERYADAPADTCTDTSTDTSIGTSADSHAAHVSTLVRLLFPYLHRSGRVAETELLGRAALRVARRLDDEVAEAYALGDLAGLHFLTGRHNEALTLNDRALALWQRLGVVSRIRRCLNNRGLLLDNLGRHTESGQALRQSLALSSQLDDPYGEALTYQHLGNLYEHTDPQAAIEQHRRSLAIGDAIGNVIVQHTAHCNIGYAHLTLGEPAAAVPHFDKSLRILGGHGDWHGESQTRLGLVRALRLLGRTERAARECDELLHRADARADRYIGGLARHQHGLLLRERGRVREAYGAWRAALEALDGTDEKTVLAELRELLADERPADDEGPDGTDPS